MNIIKARQLVHEYIRRDEEGNVEHVMPKVKPDTNAAEILERI